MNGRRILAGLLASLLAAGGAGCSKGSSPQTSPSPPTGLTAAAGPGLAFDDVVIAWTEPAEEVDGYELEGRLESGPFERLHDGLIPRGVVSGMLTLEPTVPELAGLDFRIRSARGGARSDWSTLAHFVRGIRPPTGFSATLREGAAIDLVWTNASSVADAIRLERADADAYQATGPFAPLAITFGAAAFTDGAPHELVHHAYRLSYGKGGVWSAPVTALAGPVPLFPPGAVTAAVVAGGVRVTWTNRSTVATRVTVTRWPPGTPVELAAGATSFLDPVSTPWPSTHYTVDASAPALPGQPSGRAWCLLRPFDAAGPAGPLQASAPDFDDSIRFVRAGDGTFHWMSADISGQPVVASQGTGGVERHPLSYQVEVRPQLQLDGAGQPHALGFTVPPWPAPRALVHEWREAAGWRSETIAGYDGGGSTMEFAVDGLGRLHLLENMQHCVVTGGACTLQPVPQPSGWGGGYGTLVVGRDGTAFVLSTGYGPEGTPVALATRAPGGGWALELVPVDPSYNPEPRVLAGTGGDAALLFQRNDPTAPPGVIEVRYLTRRGGAWSATESVGDTVFSVYDGAATPDLSRVIVRTSPGDIIDLGMALWSRGASGWTGATLASDSGGPAWMGLLDAGQAWILARPSGNLIVDPRHQLSLWEER